ncbi:hypothetical protein LXL04_035109 [Taraxacum kok-saghyz]
MERNNKTFKKNWEFPRQELQIQSSFKLSNGGNIGAKIKEAGFLDPRCLPLGSKTYTCFLLQKSVKHCLPISLVRLSLPPRAPPSPVFLAPKKRKGTLTGVYVGPGGNGERSRGIAWLWWSLSQSTHWKASTPLSFLPYIIDQLPNSHRKTTTNLIAVLIVKDRMIKTKKKKS